MAFPASKRTSLADIAKVAKVHRMTVSRALRDDKRLPEKTRQRIKKIAEEMGYERRSIVSTVMGQMARSRHVEHATPLLLLTDFALKPDTDGKWSDPNNWQHQLVKGAFNKAKQLGFRLEVMSYADGDFSSKRLNDIIEARGIQGVIINNGYVVLGQLDHPKIELNWDRLAAVTLGAALTTPRKIPLVQSDIMSSFQMIFDQIEERGYRRVGMIYHSVGNRLFNNVGPSNLSYFQRDLPKSQQIPMLDFAQELTLEQLEKWYRRYRPEVVIGPDIHAKQHFPEIGVRIPEDVGYVSKSVVHENDRISGIYQDKGWLSAAAVEIVVGNLISENYGLSEMSSRTLVPTVWVEGETLGRAKTAKTSR